MTVENDELVFANAGTVTLYGGITTTMEASGGGARMYNHFRAKRVRGSTTTYFGHARTGSYHKMTDPDTSDSAELTQGPRTQVSDFMWPIAIQAGDEIGLEWEAFLQGPTAGATLNADFLLVDATNEPMCGLVARIE